MYAYAIYGTSIPVFIPVAEMVTMWLGLFVWLCELGVFVGCECKSAESEGDICTHSCVAVLVNKSTCNNLGAKGREIEIMTESKRINTFTCTKILTCVDSLSEMQVLNMKRSAQ